LAPAAGGRRLNSARVAGGRVGLIDHGLIRHHNNLRADTQIRLGPYVPTLPSLGTTEQILQAPQCAGFAELISDDPTVGWIDEDVFDVSKQVPALTDDLAPNNVPPPWETGHLINRYGLPGRADRDRIRPD